jgi:hypothetical protein
MAGHGSWGFDCGSNNHGGPPHTLTLSSLSCRWGIGCDGIQPVLEKLVNVDVKSRGSKVVAMLPNWSHAPWFPLILTATRIYYVTSTVAFINPFTDLKGPTNFM